MGRYLAELKQLEAKGKTENTGIGTLINQINPPADGSLGLLGTPPAIFPEKKVTRPNDHAFSSHTEPFVSEDTATDLPALCDLLGLSWEQVEAQVIFDSYDRGRIDSGGYSALWVIRYLLSWQAGGCCVPFGLLRDEVITQHIEKLQLTQPDGETVNQWLSVNIGKKQEAPYEQVPQ